MLRWPWQTPKMRDSFHRLQLAEERMLDLKERAERAVGYIEKRDRENHWTGTVNEIIRAGRGKDTT